MGVEENGEGEVKRVIIETPYAGELIIKKLDGLRGSGEDPNECLNQSIINSWQDVFPKRQNTNGSQATKEKTRDILERPLPK